MNSKYRVGTIAEVLDILVRSNFASAEQAAELVEHFRHGYKAPVDMPEDVTAFSTFLVDNGILTTWQCEKMRYGKWRGFHDIQGFVLLDDLGGNDDDWYFLARDIGQGKIVRLAVTPRSKSVGDVIEYRVDYTFD